MASRSKRTRTDSAILDRLESDSRGAQTPLERGQTRLTCDNKLSSSDGQLGEPSCAADLKPDTCCDKSQPETGDSDTHEAAIIIERARIAVGTESVSCADFDNLQAANRGPNEMVYGQSKKGHVRVRSS